MKNKYIKLGFAISAMSLYFAGCGDDVLVSEEASQFSTVNSLDAKDCSDSTEGSMAFLKSKATMYVCSEGEWIAMKDEEAIQYRCESKELKDKSGFAIICDGDTIGVVKNGKDGKDGSDGKNGTNGTDGKDGKNGSNGTNGSNGSDGQNGASVDSAAINKAIKDALSSASAKNQKEIDEALKNLSSASAKNQKDVDDALKNLSSASAKNEKDLNDKLSSTSREIDEKFDDAYSSLSAELEDKKCEIVNTERNDEKAIITVFIKCGEAETEMQIPFTVPNENLEKKFTKHVVVRLPVEKQMKTNSDDLYDELWTYLKSGKYSELSIIDLDNKYDATGKMFVTDLVASASQPFVTVEEVNKNEVKYNVIRLEGDIDVTNLTTPIAQLRIKMNLSILDSAKVDFVYNTIVDLTDKDPNVLDATDTVVIDFLTDYKTARVKNLLKNGRDFEEALLQANDELAKALALKKDGEDYPQFEHYAPNELGLNEHFNSVLWIMALTSQANLSTNVNKVYNDFRTVFAEEGNFNKPVKTVFNGSEQNLFFVDYLALLLNANYDMYRECGGRWCFDIMYEDYVYAIAENYYKILQKGFVDAYRLDLETAMSLDNYNMFQKSIIEDGYFRYFKYNLIKEVWIPVTRDTRDFMRMAVILEKGPCTSIIENSEDSVAALTYEGIDFSMKCWCESTTCSWNVDDNVCEGREEGYRGTTVNLRSYEGELYDFVCKYNCDWCLLSPNRVYPSSSSSSSSSEVSISDRIVNILNLACDEDVMKDETKNLVKVNEKELELSTMTGYAYFKCDYIQKSGEEPFYEWVSADDGDVKFQLACNAARKNDVKPDNGVRYICQEYEPKSSTSSHYWRTEYYEEFYGENRCFEDTDGEIRSQEINGKAVYKTCKRGSTHYQWWDTEPGDYCKDNVKVDGETMHNISATTQLEPNEELPEDKIFDQKCNFNGTFYVHSTSKAAWMNVNQYCEYVYRDPTYEYDNTWRIGKNYRIFMEGYTDRKLYLCDVERNGDNNCEETTEEVVRGLNIVNSLGVVLYATETTAQNQLNLLANMTEYKKASEDLFITEVLLPGATEKTTLAASAKRLDWHEFTLDEQCSIDGRSKYLHYTASFGDVPSSSGSTTQDRICTLDDGARYFKADSNSEIDGYWDDAINGGNNYSDKWYSVKEYCHTKSRDCYKENEPKPESAQSSAICEFPEYHDEKIVYACDGSTGEWVEWQKFCDANKEVVSYGRQCDHDDEGNETDCENRFNISYLNESWTNLSCSHDTSDEPTDVKFYCGLGFYKLKDSDTWKQIQCLTR